jgi:hypothetical protein
MPGCVGSVLGKITVGELSDVQSQEGGQPASFEPELAICHTCSTDGEGRLAGSRRVCVLHCRQGNMAKAKHTPKTEAKKQNYIIAMHHNTIPKG